MAVLEGRVGRAELRKEAAAAASGSTKLTSEVLTRKEIYHSSDMIFLCLRLATATFGMA